MAETKKIPERAELAQQDKWAIEDIYATLSFGKSALACLKSSSKPFPIIPVVVTIWRLSGASAPCKI